MKSKRGFTFYLVNAVAETGIKVGDVMRTPLVTVEGDATVFEAAKKMRDKKIGSLVVVDKKNAPYGVITTTDLVYRALARKRGGKVKAFASKPLLTIKLDADLSEAAKMMRDESVKRLVVIKGDKPAGIISQKDIIRVSPSLYDLIAERRHYGKTMLFPGR